MVLRSVKAVKPYTTNSPKQKSSAAQNPSKIGGKLSPYSFLANACYLFTFHTLKIKSEQRNWLFFKGILTNFMYSLVERYQA